MIPLSNKTLATGIILFVVVVMATIVLIVVQNEDKGQVAPSVDQVSQEQKLQGQIAEIIKSKDITRCGAVTDAIYSAACVNNIALTLAEERGDISYCARVDGKLVSRTQCEQQVVYKKSLQNEDIAVCKESTFENIVKQCEESFYFSLALKKNDPTVCYRDSDKTKGDMCYDRVFLLKNKNMADLKTLSCGDLRSPFAEEDCRSFKSTFSAQVSTERIFSFCEKQKTNLFQDVCALSGGMGLSLNSIK